MGPSNGKMDLSFVIKILLNVLNVLLAVGFTAALGRVAQLNESVKAVQLEQKGREHYAEVIEEMQKELKVCCYKNRD